MGAPESTGGCPLSVGTVPVVVVVAVTVAVGAPLSGFAAGELSEELHATTATAPALHAPSTITQPHRPIFMREV